ncbi:MAG: phosphotransferase [Aeromicrobium sp.]|nr:phosphotransferase [Aeromicrobium sp.]
MSGLVGMDVPALEAFLREQHVPVAGPLTVDLIQGGRSNLTYRASDGQTAWVVRRPPTSGLTPSAHDMAREWAVTRALGPTDVPVAPTVAFDPQGVVLGAPMTVVEFVAGHTIRSQADLGRFTDAEVQANASELVRVLARLHDVDYRAVGLGEFGRPAGFVARQVATWARQWESVKTRELADVDRLHAALMEAVPPESESTIVHGDFRVDNTIASSGDLGSISAVVDWEMSTLGDPLTDVALMCAYRQPIFDEILGESAAWTSDRYPSADALAEQYSIVSGRELAHWSFYLALANFKLGVIGEGITHRQRAGSGAGGADRAAGVTGEFMAAGLAAMAGASA